MNHWIVLFEDGPEMQDIRAKYFDAHVKYLTSQPQIFVDGASLSAEEGRVPSGGMWIVKSDNREDILTLIEGDPMYKSGARQFKIFATGKILST